MIEETLQRAVASYLDSLMEKDLLFFFHPPNAPRSKIAGGKLKLAGMKAGVPDCVITFPKGKTIYIELKTPKGRLGKPQKAVHAQLERMQIPVYTVATDNAYMVKHIIRRILLENGMHG